MKTILLWSEGTLPMLHWRVWAPLSFPYTFAHPLNEKHSLAVITAIFPGELGLAGFNEAKDDGNGGDNWSYKTCNAPITSSALTNQHPMFYRPDALPLAQPTVSSLKEKCHIPRTC